ncbi:carbohydrate ABC transporter permease [Herbiconiux sp. A18JL235]|uniref:Carbohydrate ABC transporter permease n=1 Tax=Herbiconiux sp. A18JL235 TaxID=3152363 RepID=A0AB39BHJ5_9MICO
MTIDVVQTESDTSPRDSAPPPVRSRSRSRGRRVEAALAYFVLTIGALLILGPFVVTILTSFRTSADMAVNPGLWPAEWTLDSYVTAFTEVPLARMILNGLFISTVATAGGLLASLLGAFALAKLKFRGQRTYFGLVLFTLLIPGTVTLIPLYIIIRSLGLIDSPWALILPLWTGSAFAVFFLRQHLMTMPVELYEAAILDGCSTPGVVFRIFLPLLRGPLSILAILNFLASWNDLLGPLVYLSSPDQMTPTVGLTYFQGQYTSNLPVILAGALVIVIPTTIIFLLFSRQVREGLAISGLK